MILQHCKYKVLTFPKAQLELLKFQSKSIDEWR